MIYTRKMFSSTFEDKHVSKDEKKWKNGKKSCSRLVCFGIYQAMTQPKRVIFLMKIVHDVTF
jgi:dTDP-4-amino-4,6-dideoxygalactose transaminase